LDLARVLVEFCEGSKPTRTDPEKVAELSQELGKFRDVLKERSATNAEAYLKIIPYSPLIQKLNGLQQAVTEGHSKVPPDFLTVFPDLFPGSVK